MAYRFNPLTGQFDLVGVTTIPPGTGDVIGPASSTPGNIPVFDDGTGKVLADSGVSLDDLSNYGQPFVVADWVLSVDSYSLTVSKATHGKDNPVVVVYEEDGSNFIRVETGVRVDASENVIITVEGVPDLRFNGKIIIS